MLALMVIVGGPNKASNLEASKVKDFDDAIMNWHAAIVLLSANLEHYRSLVSDSARVSF